MTTARPAGHRWEQFARHVIAEHMGLCITCAHGGAGQVEHVIPQTERPDLAWSPSNCRCAHGSPGNPCPVCSPAAGKPVYCGQLRSFGSIERARVKIIGMIRANRGTIPPELARLAAEDCRKAGLPIPPDVAAADGPLAAREPGRDW